MRITGVVVLGRSGLFGRAARSLMLGVLWGLVGVVAGAWVLPGNEGAAGSGAAATASAPAPTASRAAAATSRPVVVAATQKAAEVKEPWVNKPTAQWPQILLSHDLRLKDKREMGGASAGLVRLEDRRVVMATARHLLGDAGGFVPALKFSDLDRLVASWTLCVPGTTTAVVTVGKLASKVDTDLKYDCVGMWVGAGAVRAGVRVLKVRTEALVG